MKALNLIILGICVCCIVGLKTLKKQQIQNKYQIGTISDLYFRIEDKIFFRSDDDIFGYISQKDGSLLQVYELEDDEQILRFVRSYEIFISKNKTLNIFLTPHSVYKSLTSINKYLSNHPEYTKVVDFIKTGGMSVYVLTDKYLLQIQFKLQNQQYSDKILIELKNASEEFLGLVSFLNVDLGKEDTYLVSTVKDDKASKICFRKVSNLQANSSCFQIQKDPIVDIVDSSDYIYIQFQKYALAFTTDLRYIAKIDSKPLHYFNGLISLSETHKFYDPAVKTTYDTILVVQHESIRRPVMALKIEQKAIIVQEKEKQTFTEIMSIPKDAKDPPRKAWSNTQKDNVKKLRLYVEFDDGRLVCYSLDRETKKYQQVWKITTMTANKVVTGQIEAQDIEDDDDKQVGQDINEKAKP